MAGGPRPPLVQQSGDTTRGRAPRGRSSNIGWRRAVSRRRPCRARPQLEHRVAPRLSDVVLGRRTFVHREEAAEHRAQERRAQVRRHGVAEHGTGLLGGQLDRLDQFATPAPGDDRLRV